MFILSSSTVYSKEKEGYSSIFNIHSKEILLKDSDLSTSYVWSFEYCSVLVNHFNKICFFLKQSSKLVESECREEIIDNVHLYQSLVIVLGKTRLYYFRI